jgi:NADPH-dependent 2,4-dienoyl-CoA reductase/sulfur reductase-like enzyme
MSGHFDVIVVGGGPAGIAAAISAAESGKSVALLDDNPRSGGQIWRQGATLPRAARHWLGKLASSTVTCFPGARAYNYPRSGVVSAECGDESIDLQYGKLILATGARELFLPFPGWTLPNVFGAGGLDAMVRGGLPIAGKRVVVAGTGPLLLAVAAHLAGHGAKVVAICEQATLHRMASFGARMITHPGKLLQGVSYRWVTRGAETHFGCWVAAANGERKLESVTLRQRDREWKMDCDYLACGFHLVPNTELAQLLGCRTENGFVAVDQLQQTSVTNVFAAGEPTGIGGVELALLEGEMAGLAAAGRIAEAQRLIPQVRKAASFVRALREACALDPRLRKLAEDTTIVCRCEDVTYGALRERSSWRDAKLHTRCGMGPCQGRICGAAAEFLFGWRADSIRPPVFPALISSLARFSASSADSQEDL